MAAVRASSAAATIKPTARDIRELRSMDATETSAIVTISTIIPMTTNSSISVNPAGLRRLL